MDEKPAIPAGWTAHEPGPCPVPPETVVEVVLASPFFRPRNNGIDAAGTWFWQRTGGSAIIAYRIVDPAPAAAPEPPAPAPAVQGWRVRGLEWGEKDTFGAWRANTPFGTYSVGFRFGVWSWFSEWSHGACEDEESGKAAAQADFEASTSASIEPAPAVSPEEHERVVAENARLREALAPFAAIADMEERADVGASVIVNVERCRDARAALKGSA